MKRLADKRFRKNCPVVTFMATLAKTIVLGYFHLSCPVLDPTVFVIVTKPKCQLYRKNTFQHGRQCKQ